ncbi:MAG: hypothetical protein SPF22_00570 [Candidatus Onthovivens sp.]|nr:hypothetical protein [Candidatus Onthovivens sp.]
MKITKKLRDVTPEELKEWYRINCNNHCDGCIFDNVYCCIINSNHQWVHHKDLYSDKFLDQTIEVEVPDILDKEEKEYLSAVIKPFRHRIEYIRKFKSGSALCISIKMIDNDFMYFPNYVNTIMYKGLVLDRRYTLKELGL